MAELALALDPDAKPVLLPFAHLQDSLRPNAWPRRKKPRKTGWPGAKATFSAQLMTHNTKVSIFTLALGMTWGFGTILMLFYNGVILGAVAVDYILGGQTKFLLGWLMPHGRLKFRPS